MSKEGLGHILVVDDEEDIREILEYNLRGEGYSVETVESAEEALERNLAEYDLLILDIMMSGMTGLRLAETIRNDLRLAVPIVFLTAKDTENDLLTGFNLGADDYIKKPFSIKELLVRIRAILQRQGTRLRDEEFVSGGPIELDIRAKRARVEEKVVDLTKKEFEILELLMRHPGEVFSREAILMRVWDDGTVVLERTVDVHIARIRKKIGPAAKHITQRTGYGYSFEL